MRLAEATAPSAAEIDALAREAAAALPELFRSHLVGLAVIVEELADQATIDALGLDDPFSLTGLYEGFDLRGRGDGAAEGPDRIVLYRRAILDEWVERGNVTLRELVAHIVVHEVAHHFGMSDDDIARIDDWTA